MAIYELSSGYVGSVESIHEFYYSLGDFYKNVLLSIGKDDRYAQLMQDKLDYAISDANPNKALIRHFFEDSTLKFPQSYKDLWLSGMIDVMEIILAPWRYESATIEAPTYVEFIAPNNIPIYSEVEEGESDQVDFIKEWMDEWMESTLGREYFEYPNDGYAKPAISKEAINSSYVIADGEIIMNGTVVLMYPEVEFKDGEMEVVLFQISESTKNRYRSFAELVFIEFSYNFMKGEFYTKNDLLKADSRFSLIFDES